MRAARGGRRRFLTSAVLISFALAGAWKQCKPCRDTRGDGWAMPESFQIRCPGLDGKFGSGVKFPRGTDYDRAQWDNMSNFCDGTFGNGVIPFCSQSRPGLLDQDPASARLKIQLANTSWQALPSGVMAVLVGLDGRLWYDCLTYTASSPERLKAAIETEFARPAPQIRGCRIVLFEPGGRVWFYEGSKHVLIGYDGKQWVEQDCTQREDDVEGRCLTRGGLIEGAANRWAGGAAWFICGRGIRRFDGKGWSYQPIEGVHQWADDIYLAVSADGKTAVANNRNSRVFWIYHAGQWNRFALLSGKLCVAPDAAEEHNQPGGRSSLERSPWTGHRPRSGHLGQRVRRKIQAILAQWPGTNCPARRPEARHGPRTVPGRGRAGVHDCRGDWARCGPARTRPGDLRPRRPDHRSFRRQFTRGWAPHYMYDAPGVLSASGKQVWLPFRGLAEPSRLLDLQKKQFVDALPNDSCTYIQAVAGDGRVYVSGRGPVLVYTPSAPAPHKPLKVARFPGKGLHLAVGDDGAIWAETKRKASCASTVRDGRPWPRPAAIVSAIVSWPSCPVMAAPCSFARTGRPFSTGAPKRSPPVSLPS